MLVAPCVGAWIETLLRLRAAADSLVAPCVGAWIETEQALARVSTLKQVAPCVGAWIETIGGRAQNV